MASRMVPTPSAAYAAEVVPSAVASSVRSDPPPRRGVPGRLGDHAGELRHRPGLVDGDQQRIAAGLHQVFMRVSKGRQQCEITGIDHRGAVTGQVIQPVRLA